MCCSLEPNPLSAPLVYVLYLPRTALGQIRCLGVQLSQTMGSLEGVAMTYGRPSPSSDDYGYNLAYADALGMISDACHIGHLAWYSGIRFDTQCPSIPTCI